LKKASGDDSPGELVVPTSPFSVVVGSNEFESEPEEEEVELSPREGASDSVEVSEGGEKMKEGEEMKEGKNRCKIQLNQ
jgi:hypothetical protein